jgi:hypothetical protein
MAAEANVETPPDAEALRRAAGFEVEAWNAIWRDDVSAALNAAEGALDALEGGQELRPYRALWLYMAACWAHEVAQRSGGTADGQRAEAFKTAARQCAGPLPWNPNFGDANTAIAGSEYDESSDRALQQLKQLGLRGRGFERRLTIVKDDLESMEAERYHRSLAFLGELLGFEAALPGGPGAPDTAWRDGDVLTIVFEAKTEEAPDKALSLDVVRQAGTHLAWVQDHMKWRPPKRGEAVIVGQHTRVGDGVSRTVAGDVALATPDEVMGLFVSAVEVHREVRARSRGLSDEQLRTLLRQGFERQHLTVNEIADRLVRRRVAAMT